MSGSRRRPLKLTVDSNDGKGVTRMSGAVTTERIEWPGTAKGGAVPCRAAFTSGRVDCPKEMALRAWPSPMLLLSMLYMFYWNSLVHHVPLWATGGDLWGMYRGAQYVSWGSLGQIYTPSDAIVTLPGMPILLAPCAILSAKLHLTATYGVVLARPTVALILQPYEVLLSSTVVFAADALAERLGATQRHRIALTVLCRGHRLAHRSGVGPCRGCIGHDVRPLCRRSALWTGNGRDVGGFSDSVWPCSRWWPS